MSIAISQILIIYSTIVTFISLFFNLFILIIFFTQQKLRSNGCLYLIVSLTSIDFLTQITVLPYIGVLYFPQLDSNGTLYYNPYAIIYTGFLPASLFMSSTLLTIFIAIERFYAIYFPLKFFASKKWMRAVFALTISSILTTGLSWFILKTAAYQVIPNCMAFSCYASNQAIYLYFLINAMLNIICIALSIGLFFKLYKKPKNSYQATVDKINRLVVYVLLNSIITNFLPLTIYGMANYMNFKIGTEFGPVMLVFLITNTAINPYLYATKHCEIRHAIEKVFHQLQFSIFEPNNSRKWSSVLQKSDTVITKL